MQRDEVRLKYIIDCGVVVVVQKVKPDELSRTNVTQPQTLLKHLPRLRKHPSLVHRIQHGQSSALKRRQRVSISYILEPLQTVFIVIAGFAG